MNLISQLQNFNIVETVFCDLIQNGLDFEMVSYSSPAKRVSDMTGTHTLSVAVTDNARLEAHWEGFISTHTAPTYKERVQACPHCGTDIIGADGV